MKSTSIIKLSICILLILCISQNTRPQTGCPCNCMRCSTKSPVSENLFSFSADQIRTIAVSDGSERAGFAEDDNGWNKIVDSPNSFVPYSSESIEDPIENAEFYIRVNFIDSYRDICIDGNSVYIAGAKYTGGNTSLDELKDILRKAIAERGIEDF